MYYCDITKIEYTVLAMNGIVGDIELGRDPAQSNAIKRNMDEFKQR